MFLGRHNAACLSCCLEDGVAVKRFDGVHVQHAHANALTFEIP
jgi:hypothetical protein